MASTNPLDALFSDKTEQAPAPVVSGPSPSSSNPLDSLFSGASTPAPAPSAPAAAETGNPLDNLFSSGSSPLSGQPSISQQPEAVQHLYQDETQPWYKRAWDWANTPVTESVFGLPESRPGAGGFERGVEKLASGLTSPLSLALTAATFGTGGLVESAGATALKESGLFAADEIPQIMRASEAALQAFKEQKAIEPTINAALEAGGHDMELLQRAKEITGNLVPDTKFGDPAVQNLLEKSGFSEAERASVANASKTIEEARTGFKPVEEAVRASGVDPALWKRAQDVLYNNGLTEQDLLGGNLVERGTFQLLRKAVPTLPIAATVRAAKTANSLMNAGFTFQQFEMAAQMSPRFLDALKEGDYDKAWEYGTEAVAGAGLGLLGTPHALHSAGELFKPLIEEGKFRPNDEWLAIDRANKEREAMHAIAEQHAIDIDQNARNLLGHDEARPIIGDSEEVRTQKADELATTHLWRDVQQGDQNIAAAWHDALSEAAGREDRITPTIGQLLTPKEVLPHSQTEVLHSNEAGEIRVGADGRPVVWLGPEGWDELRETIAPGTRFYGVSLSPEDASLAEDVLPADSPVRQLLAQARAASPQGLITTTQMGIPQAIGVVSEELHHTWQRELSSDGEIDNHLKPEQWTKLASLIPESWSQNLDEVGYSKDPIVRVAETAAQFMSERYKDVPNPPSISEIAKFLAAYYNEVEATHGANARDSIKETNNIARQHVEDINAKQGQDEAGLAEHKESPELLRRLEERRTGRAREVTSRETEPPTRKPEGLKALPIHEDESRYPVAFVSPNVHNLPNVQDAEIRLGSRPQKFLENLSKDFADALPGAKAVVRPAIGHWEGGAENSTIQRFAPGTDPDVVEYHNAFTTKAGYQNMGAGFIPEAGSDKMFQFRVPNTRASASEIGQVLEAHGIPGDTIEPVPGGYLVHVVSKGDELRAQVAEAAARLDAANIGEVNGRAFQHGDYNSREDAQRVLDSRLNELEQKHPTWRPVRQAFESRPDYVGLSKLVREPREPFVSAVHGTRAEGLETVSPEKQFTGPQRGAEAARAKRFPEDYVKKSYWRVEGTHAEPFYEKQPYQYKARFNNENLYPYVDDPDSLLPAARAEAASRGIQNQPGAIGTIYERMMRDNGYDGYYHPMGEIATFKDTPVEKQAQEGSGPLFGQKVASPLYARDLEHTWDDIKPYLTAEEIAKHSTPEKQQALASAYNMMPTHEEWVAAARAGRAGQMWYERSSRAFDALMDMGVKWLKPADKDKFLNFTAALSPVQPVRQNLLMAINMWAKWDKAGRPTDVEWKNGKPNKNASLYRIMKGRGASPGVDLASRLGNAIRALQGEPMSGPKVSAFTKNLGEDVNRVTNDTWMAVIGGQDPNRINQPKLYDAMSAHIRRAAEAEGIAPRQAQAAVWSFIKSLAELSGWGNDRWIPPQEIIKQGLLTPELVASHSSDFADLLANDHDIRAKIKELGGDLNALDQKLQEYVPGKPLEAGTQATSQQLLGAANRLEAARTNAKIAAHLARKSEGQPGLFDTEFNPNLLDQATGFGGGTRVNAKYMPLFARDIAPEEARIKYDELQRKIENRHEELDKEATNKGIKYYFPEYSNLLKTAQYEGPTPSAEEVQTVAQGYHELATHNQQAKEVLSAMRRGESFKEAIQHFGSIDLAKRFGGKMDFEGPVSSEYRPYPQDLLDLHKQRDEIGSEQLKKSVSEISDRLKNAGLNSDETGRVMDYYALDPNKTDVFAQHMAAEHTQGLVDQDLHHQLEQIYSRLAVQRDIPIDDEQDFFRDRKTTEDAKKALKAVVSYFHPELEKRPQLGTGTPLFARNRPENGLPSNIDDMIRTNKFKDLPKEYQDRVLTALKRIATGQMSDRELNAAKYLAQEQDKNWEIGSANDLLHNYIEDYMTRVYKDHNPEGRVILSNAKQGRFATNVNMARQRVYESTLAALLKSPKEMLLDPVQVTAQGRAQLIKAAANRQLIDKLRDSFTRASDGRPAVVLSGQGRVVTGQNGEDPKTFIQPDRVRKINISDPVVESLQKSGDLQRFLDDGTIKDITPYIHPNNIRAAIARLEDQAGKREAQYDAVGNNKLRTDIMLLKSMVNNNDFSGLRDFNDKLPKRYAWDPQDYISLDNGAMKGWNFITNDSAGNGILVRSDIRVHPEFAEYLKNRLGLAPSTIAQHPIGKALLGAGTKLKHTLLSLSPFHMVQIGLRGVMTGVNPFTLHGPDLIHGAKVDPMDPNSPTKLYKMVEHGMTTGTDYRAIQEHSEGVSSGGNALKYIPGIGKSLANAMDWYQDFLFKRYIPAIKATAAEHMFDEYSRLHPEWSTDRVARVAAAHANDSFGGINWKAMGRSATTQDWGRLMLLAPDWLESEMRSGIRLFNRDEGGLGRAQVAKMALGLWGIARVLNLLTTGNAHYEAPFGLAVKNKEGKETIFGIRTLPTDLLHAASDPVGFIKGRLSPTVRLGQELLTQRDVFGRKLAPEDMWVDVFRNMAPIPVQSIGQAITSTGPEVGNVGQMWKAGGGTAQTYTTPGQKMAAELASNHNEDGPIDRTQMARHRQVMRLEDQLRAGEITWPDLVKLTYQTDQLKESELKKIQNNFKKTQGLPPEMASLYTRASRLPAAEYLQLWDVLNPSEKAALATLTLQVQKRYLNKAKKDMTPEERAKDPTFNRFMRMIPQTQHPQGAAPQPQSYNAPPTAQPTPLQQEVAYLYTATHPQSGHKVGSNDGRNWFDHQTGEPVNG